MVAPAGGKPKDAPGDLWKSLAGEDSFESALWNGLLLAESEREQELAFSPLNVAELALGIETVYEGYLVHYGRSRLFAVPEPNLALLLGDRLYARGLVLISALGNVTAVADLANLLELCARLQAEGGQGDGALWAAGISRLARGGIAAAGEEFLSSGNGEPLLRLARETVGSEPVERALAVHAQRFA